MISPPFLRRNGSKEDEPSRRKRRKERIDLPTTVLPEGEELDAAIRVYEKKFGEEVGSWTREALNVIAGKELSGPGINLAIAKECQRIVVEEGNPLSGYEVPDEVLLNAKWVLEPILPEQVAQQYGEAAGAAYRQLIEQVPLGDILSDMEAEIG